MTCAICKYARGHADDCPNQACARCERLGALANQSAVSLDFIEAVEREIGMGSGAWDMVAPSEVIAAVIRATLSAPEREPGRMTCSDCGEEMAFNVPRLGPDGGFVHKASGQLLCANKPKREPCKVCGTVGGGGEVAGWTIGDAPKPCPKCGGSKVEKPKCICGGGNKFHDGDCPSCGGGER